MAGNPEDFGSFRAPESENTVADGAHAKFHDLVYRTDCFPHGGGGGGMTNGRAERELGELYVELGREGKLNPTTLAALRILDDQLQEGGWKGGHHYPPYRPGGPVYMAVNANGEQLDGATDPSMDPAMDQVALNGAQQQAFGGNSPYELDTMGGNLGQQAESVIAQNTGINPASLGSDAGGQVQMAMSSDGQQIPVIVGQDGSVTPVTIDQAGNIVPMTSQGGDSSGNVLPSTINPDASAVAQNTTDYSTTNGATTDGSTQQFQVDPSQQYADSSAVTTAQNPAAAMPTDDQQTG